MNKILSIFLIINLSASLALAEKYTVGLISDLSGYNVVSGEECYRGYQVAVKEATPAVKEKINFVYEDTQSFPKNAVAALQKLAAAENNLLAISIFSSPNSLAVGPIAIKEQLPVMALAGSTLVTEKNPYAMSSWMSSSREGSTYATEMLAENLKKIAIVTTENDYMLDIARHFTDVIKSSDATIVEAEKLPHDMMDFRSIIGKILAKNPEVVFINLHTGSAPAFLKQLRQANFKGVVYGNFYISRANEIQAAGIENAEGVRVVNIKNDNQQFKDTYKEHYNEEVRSVLEYACYSGLQHLIQGIDKVLKTSEPLTRQSLFSVISANGTIDILGRKVVMKDRWMQHDYSAYQIIGGKLVAK